MDINIDRLEKLQKILKERKRKPIELLNTVLKLLDFKKVEIKLYNTLLKKEMKMNELVQRLNISERSIRTHIKTLYKKGFIKRKALMGDRLKYVYSSVTPKIAWKIVKKRVNETLNQVDKIFQKISVFL